MPEIDDNLIFFVSQENGIGMDKLLIKMKMGNRNTFFNFIKEKENQGIIETKKIGRTRHVYLKSLDKKVDTFINTFGKRLDLYEKEVNNNLTLLEKNLPLITKDHPMKKVKTKEAVLELDKERQVYRDMGKRIEGHAYTWKTRAKPRKHFDVILQLLHKLYQESSVLTFGDTFTDNPALIKGFQKRSDKLIKDTCTKIEKMFKDKPDFVYAINRLRGSIYALIYKATWEKEFKKIKQS